MDPVLGTSTAAILQSSNESDVSGCNESSECESEEECSELPPHLSVPQCVCTMCPENMNKDEQKCCQTVKELQLKLNEENVPCILLLKSFQNIFNQDCHHLYINIMNDIFHDDNSEVPLNTRLRHSAYRTSISFIYGKLGKRRRTPVPSCIVAKVGESYPSDNGEYVGFKKAEPQFGS